MKSGEPFAFAGLWEPTDGTASCDVATCPPNALVASIHNRMPVILAGSNVDLWIDPEPLPVEVAASILRPLAAEIMQVREISARVNNANYDAADVLADADPRLL